MNATARRPRSLPLSHNLHPGDSIRCSLALLCLGAVPAVAQIALVTNATEAALRLAMTNGGTIQFACDGTITLGGQITVSSNTVLDGIGHQITISGGDAARVFQVAPNVTFTLGNLTVANGLGTNGGALFNAGGLVNLTNCVFTGNRAIGPGGTGIGMNGTPAAGGALCTNSKSLFRKGRRGNEDGVEVPISKIAGLKVAGLDGASL